MGLKINKRAYKTEVQVPEPLRWQVGPLNDDARFKVPRCGRRSGKSRIGLRMCITGHGPFIWDKKRDVKGAVLCDKLGKPIMAERRKYKGLVHGARLAWVAPDYPQSEAIWEEEIKPRFEHVVGAHIDEGNKILHFMGGTLEIVTAMNIDSRRGREYDGVVLDEGAHWDLEYGFRSVIRPTLINRRGWAFIASTTNVGSYFNQLCKEVESGSRGPNWKGYHFRTRDNERIDEEEFAELALEYPPGSQDGLQELEAELLESLGLLFKEEYFHYYDSADVNGMMLPGGVYMPFVETRMYVDLASSMKEKSDYFACIVAGLTVKTERVRRKAGIIHAVNLKIEGPEQINELGRLVDEYGMARTMIEAVQYQLTAVQHMRVTRPNSRFEPVYPDKDKRSRAVPLAAAMARGDVFWDRHASYMKTLVPQYLKFPNGREDSPHPEDHDDLVDVGSMLARDQLFIVTKPRTPLVGSVSYGT